MVIFICSPGMGFPNGTAQTLRVANLAKGLRAVGEDVFVLCLLPSEELEWGIRNTAIGGEHLGIPFEYTCGRTVRGQSFLQRRWLELIGRARGAFIVLRLLRNQAVRAVLLYQGDSLLDGFLFFCVTRLANAVYLTDITELPFYRAEPGTLGALYVAAYRCVAFRLFDGTLVVSRALERYVKPYARRSDGLLRMPILVDVDDHAEQPDAEPLLPEGRYVMYFGLLNEYKDGVLTLMRAFALVAEEFPDVSLALVGGYRRDDLPVEFKAVADELGIGDKVVITGPIDRTQAPRYLRQAATLALARPASRQADYNFPTKLGEYLASGRPVVVTRTGEIEHYLEDGVSAYLALPNDVPSFAEGLRRTLSSPLQADGVGFSGRDVAQREFDYRVGAKRLQEFIHQLVAQRKGRERRPQSRLDDVASKRGDVAE